MFNERGSILKKHSTFFSFFRTRISKSDPLDYNYTKQQREKERVWGGRAGGSISGGGVRNAGRGGGGGRQEVRTFRVLRKA